MVVIYSGCPMFNFGNQQYCVLSNDKENTLESHNEGIHHLQYDAPSNSMIVVYGLCWPF